VIKRGREDRVGYLHWSKRENVSRQDQPYGLQRWVWMCQRGKKVENTFNCPSFPNASIGNPDETVTGPPINTFGGDDFGINSHQRFLIGKEQYRGENS
jgi:hypothetical protein